MTVAFVAGWLLAAGASIQAPGLVGRWDLTMTVGDTLRFPSWFEVTGREGPMSTTLAGRFQGRFGHATPIAEIIVAGTEFRFDWPVEGRPRDRPSRVEGSFQGADAISGVLIGSDGLRYAFTGVRAPRLERAGPVRFGPAIDLLADGMAGWRIRDPRERNGWRLENGVLANEPPSADLVSVATFRDFRLHAEVNVSRGGNSGIYLRGRHEVQVQDDFGNQPGSRRMGGVYGQITPTSLPARRPGEWQEFDITLVGRRLTVMLNGVTIIDGAEIPGITGGALDSDEGTPGPLMLQGDHTGIRYRNLRIEPVLDPEADQVAEVHAADRARFAAQVSRDTAALRNLLGDELVYIHSNALIESKAHFIETVATGRIRYDEVVPLESTYRIYGATAVGNGKVRVRVQLNGQAVAVDLLFTTVHVRRQGRWELIAWQSTRAQ